MIDIRSGVCPLCEHDEIVLAEGSAEAAVLHERGFVDAKAFGELAQYVCRNCGFTQWFAREPGKIPISQRQGTKLLKARKAEGPYR